MAGATGIFSFQASQNIQATKDTKIIYDIAHVLKSLASISLNLWQNYSQFIQNITLLLLKKKSDLIIKLVS